MSAKLDIVVIGATGFTGRLTCKYLMGHSEKFTWGIAGRSQQKLKALADELGHQALPTFVVDVEKPASLDAVCASARCIISCAGPFNLCGMPVVEACVRNSVHYVDSTGEFTFVRRVAETFHDEATKKGIVLVSCCGFDSVPADLGNYVVHREAGEELKEVCCYYKLRGAGISSGTASSIAEIMNYMTKADMSPTSLNPTGPEHKAPLAAGTRLGLWYTPAVRSWTAPFVMASCNERIVRRSNALAGSRAAYVESLQARFLVSLGATLGFYAMGLVMAFAPVRNYLVSRLFPTGVAYGPSEEQRKNSSFRCTFHGTTVSGKSVTTVLHSDLNMYDITGVFLVECALSALTLETKGKVVAGVLTPAFAFGDELVRRSRDAGVRITTLTEDDAAAKKKA